MGWFTLDRLDKIGSFLGGIGLFVGILTYFGQIHFTKRERQRGKFHELELSWYVGELHRHRLDAERILARPAIQGVNFRELFEGEVLSKDEYYSVSIILRFFYLVNSWYEHGYISKAEARRALTKSYSWWYAVHIEPRGRDLRADAEWNHLVCRHDWLIDDSMYAAFKGLAKTRGPSADLTGESPDLAPNRID